MSRETKEHDDDEEKRPAPAPNANQAREVNPMLLARLSFWDLLTHTFIFLSGH